MAPSIAARRVDGVQGASCPKGSAERWQRCLSREPVLSKALLPPDEEYGRDRKTRCAAEIRSSNLVPVPSSEHDHPVFQTETSALLTRRAACGRAFGGF